jgi:hypothetical protein
MSEKTLPLILVIIAISIGAIIVYKTIRKVQRAINMAKNSIKTKIFKINLFTLYVSPKIKNS